MQVFVFFSLKAESVGVHSVLCTCRATWNMAVGWDGKLDPILTHLPFLVCLTCLLTLSYQRQKPSRAKHFPCYCACKTPGITGPFSERHRNKNTPGFPKLWNLGSCGRTPRGWGGGVRNEMGWGSPAWAYVMENGTGPCGAELECRNCNGLWRSAARLNRVETLQIHKTCKSESLQLSFLTAGKKNLYCSL